MAEFQKEDLKFCHKKDGGEKAVAGVICLGRGKGEE